MYAIGAEHVSIGTTRHQVVFEDGTIDIAEMDSRPLHGHQTALLAGTARFSAIAHDFGKHVVTADAANLRKVANAHGIDEFLEMHAGGGAASILDEVAQRLAARAPSATVLQWPTTTLGMSHGTG